MSPRKKRKDGVVGGPAYRLAPATNGGVCCGRARTGVEDLPMLEITAFYMCQTCGSAVHRWPIGSPIRARLEASGRLPDDIQEVRRG